MKQDRTVIAVILHGRLPYDKVWEKSDVDITVIVRDQNLTNTGYCIDEDDIVFNLDVYPQANLSRA